MVTICNTPTFIRSNVLIFLFIINSATYAVSVQDDLQNTITLEQPAKRVVTLAPFLTELLYAIDAGNRVVGTVQ